MSLREAPKEEGHKLTLLKAREDVGVRELVGGDREHDGHIRGRGAQLPGRDVHFPGHEAQIPGSERARRDFPNFDQASPGTDEGKTKEASAPGWGIEGATAAQAPKQAEVRRSQRSQARWAGPSAWLLKKCAEALAVEAAEAGEGDGADALEEDAVAGEAMAAKEAEANEALVEGSSTRGPSSGGKRNKVSQRKKVKEDGPGVGHDLYMSGAFYWCRNCGSYAQEKFRTLKEPCPGNAKKNSKAGQLARMVKGWHPLKSGESLPRLVKVQGWVMDKQATAAYQVA